MSSFHIPSISFPKVRTVKSSVTLGNGMVVDAIERSISGLDDVVYEKERAVWEAVPRGLGVFSLNGTPVSNIVGLRKFGYLGSPYGTIDAVKTVVFVDKENGECAHVAAFNAPDGTPYWIAGSKHVHIVFPHGDFVAAESVYAGQERYKYAIKIARVWNAMLPTFDAPAFHAYLAENKYTACAEAILADSEHIVVYSEKDILKFYALTAMKPSSEGLTAVSPQVAQTVFTIHKLPMATFSPSYNYPSAEYSFALDEVARRANSEGVVVYGSDAEGHVVAMWKEKSYPYVMERVVREAVISGKTQTQIRRRVAQRLSDHTADLRTYFAEWESYRYPELLIFAAWLRQHGYIPARSAWDVQSRWLTLQAQFRDASTEERLIAAKVADAAADEAAGPNVVQFVGLPCSGKSTAARALFWLLRTGGASPRWLNQDEADSNRGKYLGAIKAAIDDPDTTHILLDKSNLDAQNRKDYIALGLTPTLTIVYGHPEGAEAYKTLCTERFLARGAAHRSLCASGPNATDVAKFSGICDSMLSKYTLPNDNDILHLDVRAILEDQLKSICLKLGILTTRIEDAIAFSRAYESAIAGRRRPTFGGILIPSASMAPILDVIPEEAKASKTFNKSFHITIKYIGPEMDPMWYLEFLQLIDTPVDVRVTAIVWDDNCITARVGPGAFPCENAVPHITLGLRGKTQPVYSNTLLTTIDAAAVDCDFTLTGRYYFG